MSVIYRSLLMLSVAGILYIVHPYFIANVVAASAMHVEEKTKIYEKTLRWYPKHKTALTQLAVISLEKQDFNQAKEYAEQAIRVDPTNGRAMAVLIKAYDQLNNEGQAEKALQLATQLWPSHAYVRIQSADFWAKRGDIKQVMPEWHVLLSRHAGFHRDLFPVLKVLIETPEYRPLITAFSEQPAVWWKNFFIYLTQQQDISLMKLAGLYKQRLLNKHQPLTTEERGAYIARLKKEKQWLHAYSAWMGGLSKEERQYIGLVYDGGFEALTSPSSFSWQYLKAPHAKLRIAQTRGAKGRKAIQIKFDKRKPVTTALIKQRLLLQPGLQYTLQYRSRMDSLKTLVGLSWAVYCNNETRREISISGPMIGRTQWEEKELAFSVPAEDCSTQSLELIPSSTFAHEQLFQGTAWFDDIEIIAKQTGDQEVENAQN